MGLSGPRKRTKFSHDPNNTNWSRSESKYGQRILQSQGWKPGEYLGAKDASHAKYHTVANSSHIKIALRDDNLGLGARRGAAGGEWQTTGLGGFQDLLGRLNGQTEQELEKAQKTREVLKRNLYVEQRWGVPRFVSGGLLVGDKMEQLKPEEATKTSLEELPQATESVPRPTMDQNPPTENTHESRSKSKKRSKRLRVAEALTESIGSAEVPLDGGCQAPVLGTEPSAQAADKAQRGAEKAERKHQRQLRREARLVDKHGALAESPALSLPAQVSPVIENLAAEVAPPTSISDASINISNGRNAARQRNIKHKKMAMLDSKALNEILMIKA